MSPEWPKPRCYLSVKKDIIISNWCVPTVVNVVPIYTLAVVNDLIHSYSFSYLCRRTPLTSVRDAISEGRGLVKGFRTFSLREWSGFILSQLGYMCWSTYYSLKGGIFVSPSQMSPL